jgi:hypothetical protein
MRLKGVSPSQDRPGSADRLKYQNHLKMFFAKAGEQLLGGLSRLRTNLSAEKRREVMLRFLSRWYIALRTNNNVRLATFWLITGLWLLFNLSVFGIGPAPRPVVGEIAQRYYNEYYLGRFATDAELNPIATFFGGLWGILRAGSWLFWFFWFIWSVIYIPIAFSDEIGRLWQASVRRIRERRFAEETANLPPLRPVAAQQPAQPQQPEVRGFSLSRFLGLELLVDIVRDFLRDLIPGLISRRRR